MDRRLIKAHALSEIAVNNEKLTTPVAGVAYCVETDKVYFNNAVLPQGGGPVVPQGGLLEDPAM